KNVVAAEAQTAPAEHTSIQMAIATGLESGPAEAAAAPAANEPVPARIELPALEEAQPVAEAEPVLAAPKPIILSTISPPAPASEPAAPSTASRSARDISVAIGDGTSHGGVSTGSLRSALNQAAITRCYRDAVQNGEAPARPVSAQLEIGTNMSGRITSAKLSGGGGLPTRLVRCVEEAARLGRVREADTGEVRASFELTFRAR
ncbi:MAG TPA: hypothetical protein VJV78_18495, partial [Polyangiales bacterium]|nr:hypothetical protein [Polyangiales bacterium]